MKQIAFISLLILIVVSSTSAQEKADINLSIQISGMKSDKGQLFVGIYNSKEDFLKKRYREKRIDVVIKKAEIIFKNLPEEIYAVSIFHDENDNKKMDKNFLGIPKERYGNSNGARVKVGPPKYEDAKFELKKSKVIQIVVE